MNCYPLEITNLDSETAKELMNLFTGELSGYIRVGPKGYLYPDIFKNEANNIYTLPLRSTDIFVVSFPRSGTTLTQELVWMIANDLDYDKSYATRLTKRYWFLDSRILNHPKVIDSIKIQVEGNKEKMELLEMFTQQGAMRLHDMPSPRFIKTHFPLSLLPPALLDNVKTVYVARDPRDAVVSYYHHNKRLRNKGYTGDFKTFWNYFIKDLLIRAPFFEHVKEAWSKRHHPNMLFLFYEELVMDMPTCIHRVATFLNKQIANDQIVRLCEHLQFDNFKNNKSVSEDMAQIPELINLDEEPFIRRGKVGGWRDYFDADMTKQAEQWIANNLRDTDLRFSEI